jgi:plastocyanin
VKVDLGPLGRYQLARKSGVLIAAAVLALTALAGCGGGKKKTSAPKLTLPPVTQTGQLLDVAADPGGRLTFNQKRVDVTAGPISLVMTNPPDSGKTHSIAIEGNGIDKVAAPTEPGKKATISIDIKPGKYVFYCPVADHRAKGMFGELRVTR